MAVKQKVVECNPPEQNLQVILRALQDIQARGIQGLPENVCVNIVTTLGNIHPPSDAREFVQFMTYIDSIKEILTKECAKYNVKYAVLKSLYNEISRNDRPLSPVMSIVLQLIETEYIPQSVELILQNSSNPENLKRALRTLCQWLCRWTGTENLGPTVLSLILGMEQLRHDDMLLEVTLETVDTLFRLLILPEHRKNVGPVVLHMLTAHLPHLSEGFLKCLPWTGKVVGCLEKEKSESSLSYLQDVVNAMCKLMHIYPEYAERYTDIKVQLAPYMTSNQMSREGLMAGSRHEFGLSSIKSIDGTLSTTNGGKVGLNNLGNTCYMNSMLQALFMTKPFRNEVLRHDKIVMQIFSKLQDLFALLQHSQKESLAPNDILNIAKSQGFMQGHQHDSSEFLGYLLDTLHEQEKNAVGIVVQDTGAGSSVVSLASHCDDSNSSFASTTSTITTTIVQSSFGGRTVSASQCGQCGTKSERADNFRELQLSFPTNSTNQSVQSLLNYYLQPEKLSGDNQYHCDICGGLTDGERVTCIEEAPPRLILTLKHFRYDPKSQQRTKLLQNVKLDSHVQLECGNYELYAAVIHVGSSLDSGHYYTFARDGDEWYKFNDNVVTKTTADELCNLKAPETPYVLFYGREDVCDPENLPRVMLGSRLQQIIQRDNTEFETEKRRPALRTYNTRQNNRSNNDEPPPPGCGGGGFSNNTSNLYVC